MKTMLLIWLLAAGAGLTGKASPYDTAMAQRLSGMVAEDQLARRRVDSAVAWHGEKSIQTAEAWMQVHVIDSLHNTVIRQILDHTRSYPDYSIAGVKGADDFWLLVQHQDADTVLQKRVLDLMKFAVNYQQASPVHYAYLVDRVRLNTGKKQLYGTQFQLSPDSTTWQPRPVEDPDYLDARRKTIGLGSIHQAIQSINQSKKYYLKPKAAADSNEN